MEILTAFGGSVTDDLPDSARFMEWCADGLCVACADGSLLLVDDETPGFRLRERLGFMPASLATTVDRIVCGGIDGSLATLSATGTVLSSLGAPVLDLAAVGDRMVAGSGTRVSVSDAWAREPVDLGIGTVTRVERLGGPIVAVGGTTGVAWFDADLGVSDGRIGLPTVVSAALDPRHRCVAFGDLGGSIHLVRPERPEAMELFGYVDRVALLAWSSDAATLCATADDELTVWPIGESGSADAEEPACLVGHESQITAIASSPSNALVATGDANGVINLWAPSRLDRHLTTTYTDGSVLGLAWRGDGRILAAVTSLAALMRIKVAPGSMA